MIIVLLGGITIANDASPEAITATITANTGEESLEFIWRSGLSGIEIWAGNGPWVDDVFAADTVFELFVSDLNKDLHSVRINYAWLPLGQSWTSRKEVLLYLEYDKNRQGYFLEFTAHDLLIRDIYWDLKHWIENSRGLIELWRTELETTQNPERIELIKLSIAHTEGNIERWIEEIEDLPNRNLHISDFQRLELEFRTIFNEYAENPVVHASGWFGVEWWEDGWPISMQALPARTNYTTQINLTQSNRYSFGFSRINHDSNMIEGRGFDDFYDRYIWFSFRDELEIWQGFGPDAVVILESISYTYWTWPNEFGPPVIEERILYIEEAFELLFVPYVRYGSVGLRHNLTEEQFYHILSSLENSFGFVNGFRLNIAVHPNGIPPFGIWNMSVFSYDFEDMPSYVTVTLPHELDEEVLIIAIYDENDVLLAADIAPKWNAWISMYYIYWPEFITNLDGITIKSMIWECFRTMHPLYNMTIEWNGTHWIEVD